MTALCVARWQPMSPTQTSVGTSTTSPAQFPGAGNFGSEFFRIARHSDDSSRIGKVASKGCGKFPAPEGQRIRRAGAGKVSRRAGNSQSRAGNRRQCRNSNANVCCRSSFSRSFVDGANFDGKISNVPELVLHPLGSPRVFWAAGDPRVRFGGRGCPVKPGNDTLGLGPASVTIRKPPNAVPSAASPIRSPPAAAARRNPHPS
jgi:hypothetical protein